MDAALQLYEQKGIGQTRLEEVAKTAGVARTTLYRYIANRDDLLQQVLLRDAERQQSELEVITRYHDKLEDGLVDSILYIMRGRRIRPINKLLFNQDDAATVQRINLSPANFYALCEQILTPLFNSAQADKRIRDGVTLQQASQWTTRVVLSLIAYPEEFLEDEKALREFLEQFLVPSLLRDKSSDSATDNTATDNIETSQLQNSEKPSSLAI